MMKNNHIHFETVFNLLSTAYKNPHDFETAHDLIKKENLDINEKDEDGDELIPLAKLFTNNLLENEVMLDFLIDHGKSVVREGLFYPRHIAPFLNKPMLKKLMRLGLDVHGRDDYLNTFLHTAKSAEFIDFLVEQGVDVELKNKGEYTAIQMFRGNIEILKALVKNGANVNVVDKIGRTLLHLVTYTASDEEVAKFLIEKGLNVNARSDNGETPLHSMNIPACILEFLIEQGGDIHCKNNNGQTPLHRMSHGDKKCSEILLKAGADPNNMDNEGNIPLHYAGTIEVINTQIWVSNIELTNKEGETPLDKILKNIFCSNGETKKEVKALFDAKRAFDEKISLDESLPVIQLRNKPKYL